MSVPIGFENWQFVQHDFGQREQLAELWDLNEDITDQDYKFEKEEEKPDEPDSTMADPVAVGGGGTTGGQKQGVGKNIIPIPRDNIWNNQRVIYVVLKTRKYVDIDFSTNENPKELYVIPYQLMAFWGQPADDNPINNNLKQIQSLLDLGETADILHGKINIDVKSVTRQRLIQTGSTNTLTWDFETSQNMIIVESDRRPAIYLATGAADMNINKITTGDTTYCNDTLDDTTKDEVPQRMRWSRTIHFPQPTGGYKREALDVKTALTNTKYFIPGIQAVPNTDIGGGIEYIHNTQLNTGLITVGVTDNQGTVQRESFEPSASWPLIGIGQPIIPDETGYMKFRYQTQLETQLALKIYLKPDIYADGSSSIPPYYMMNRVRKTIPLIRQATTGSTQVICFPFA